MKMRKALMSLLLIATIICLGFKPVSNPKAEAAGLKAATSWLKLVDAEKDSESWEQAAKYFKGAVKKEQWLKVIKAVRKSSGKNISRKLRSKAYFTALPGAPKGKYVVIQFQSSFKNKKSAVETITPMLGKDGKWRVSGYYIK